ncbi:DUF6221 family protein [Streptomyces sp. NBC_01723]|uniref:DUF6221 family protein n=1 Tax=Streptomyces sp. NBC_01723 TaxID=2975921 RepID=UPI002E341561|nr:DUF6221 family protein [Streptomyces sp. NBC_01723]
MSDLVQWLREQLDEDERIAREAPPGPWYIGGAVDPTKPCQVNTFPDLRLVADGLNWLVAEHIAVHNPARVLREIDAKRQVIARYEQAHQLWEGGAGNGADAMRAGLLYCLQAHASVYADRPGYREAWRP